VGESKRRKLLDPNYGKFRSMSVGVSQDSSIPSDDDIRSWLLSEGVLAWIGSHIGNRPVEVQTMVQSLAKRVLEDKRHDWTIEDLQSDFAVGVDALKWTLWICVKSSNLVFAPDCPITLNKFLGEKQCS
jgi:hypothetical protein